MFVQESVSPVLWKFCSQIPLAFKVKFPRGLSPFARTFAAVQKPLGITVLQFVGGLLSSSMVGLMVTSCKKTFAIYCASQLCSSQRPCLHGRPLLIHASAGGTQALKGRSGLVSVESPGMHKVLFEPSEYLWWVWGLILKVILPLLQSFWGFSFALGCGVYFFGGIQHSPVDGCSAVSCNFGVLTGEDACTSFYSTILYSEVDLHSVL